ncbi:MAG: DUF4340 domain-containing protein [Treponema sp.]|jgi:hypothetical protein|nr:DUF4340 domain-containing protein [Treponema sp.]
MKRTVIIFSVLSLVLLILAFALFIPRQSDTEKKPQLIADKAIYEIEEIIITNQYDSYSVYQEEGGFAIANLPMELVYAEYLLMLLDEASRVEYIEQVAQPVGAAKASPSNLAAYGLDRPIGTAVIRYTTGESLTLIFGDMEPVSRGQYFMVEGMDAVYLMDHSRVVRFLQPLKRFFNLEIVHSRSVRSPLRTIQNLSLSGRAFPRQVFITELREDSEEELREALGFGATTHVLKEPFFRKIDQREAIEVFGSLSGLLNIEVLDYNCDDAVLASYGLSDPLVKAEYDFLRGDGSEPVRIVLKAALYQGGFVLVRDDQRVVHMVERKPFLVTSYEKLVSRWFLSPFITDVRSIVIRTGGRDYCFELSGEENQSLQVDFEDRKPDMTLFRKFYNLLVSASNDGQLLSNPIPAGPPHLSITFHYRDPLKTPDTMVFSPGSLRRH